MAELHLYNTRTRRKELFQPLEPHNVRMYVCGPTVYDYAHIGNARPVVVFDVLFRLLRHLYGKDHVTYVRNFTDIDDKIIEAAKNNKESISDLTQRTAKFYQDDMVALNALPPSHEPRATGYVEEMVAMISELLAKNHAYEAQNHVLFHVPSMQDYGGLSGRSLEDMIAGARVEVAPYKKHPADFVLWKPSDVEQPGWDSPWGRGRPGWHIECSAMAGKLLGQVFDIHGGGIDLIFPHHENEIAQSCCAHGSSMLARYWMHNGFVQVDGTKMSKSLGNFFTVHQLLEEGYPGEAIRLALLSAHYRQPVDITRAGIEEAKAQLDRFYQALDKTSHIEAEGVVPEDMLAALQDDLNTPQALSFLHTLLTQLNKSGEKEAKSKLLGGAHLLGLLQQAPDQWLRGARDLAISEEEIARAIEARNAARKTKNFALADQIRQDLLSKGIVLEDGPEGTQWKRG